MNKPVAWTKKDTLTYLNNYEFGSVTIQVQKAKDDEFNIPLYNHPVKELTDEEILDVLKKIADNNDYVYSLYEDFTEVEFSKIGIFEFAKAILRKAQEK